MSLSIRTNQSRTSSALKTVFTIGVCGLSALGGLGLLRADTSRAPTEARSSGPGALLVASSQEDLVIRRKSVAIMLKVLSYDRNLEQRCPDAVRIGLIAKSTDSDSVSCATLTAKALEAFKGKSLRGKKILAKIYFVDSFDQVSAVIEKNKLNTIYLSQGLDAWVEPMARYAEKNQIPLIACDEGYVKKGAALGVVKGTDDKPKILVNLKAAKAQGLALDARVLKIAEKVK